MSNELSVIESDVLTQEEKSELDARLDRMILQHKDNRQEINRLVFESVAAMTEADHAQAELSNKGFFKRLVGGITGSNQKLQNEIDANRAVAQYASQQTLQKLAEQNLMTFDLITAVNNKLNASINAVNDEFKNIYDGLNKFLKYNRNELARVEARLAKVEQNVNLLTWQNTIEYQEYDGEEYINMDATKKIVCLARDFYDITKGNWSTSDLLLLKTAMSTINIQPKDQVNYYDALREISRNPELKAKLLGNKEIRPIEDQSYLISIGTIEKLDALENREAYLVDTVMDYVNLQDGQVKREDVCDRLAYNYLWQRANVNLNIDVESYDMILDLLYNIKQADEDGLLMMPVGANDSELQEAEELFLHCNMEEAAERFQPLAEAGNARAMFFLGELHCWGLPVDKQNREIGDSWRKKGAQLGDVLCRLNMAYVRDISQGEKDAIIKDVESDLIALAESGDMYAQNELGSVYSGKNDEESKRWYRLSAEQGYFLAMNHLGNAYHSNGNYEEANKWYKMAGEAGYDWGYYNLASSYDAGKGVKEDKDEAIEIYKKAYRLNGPAAGQSANVIGNIYYGKENYEEANKWYELAGEAGYDWGWQNLGNDYRDGLGVSEDKDKAIEYYKKAYVMNGVAAGDSADRIGMIYYNRNEYAEAHEWFEKSGKAGFDAGWGNLAICHRYGKGVCVDTDKAIEFFKNGCALKGENLGEYATDIGNLYWDKGEYEEANKWYEKAGEAGYEEGLYKLAKNYDNGSGINEDKDKAIELYEKAYNLKGKLAGECANNIGNIYHNRSDYESANKWYVKSGESGSSYGWFNLASNYYWGRGVSSSYQEAIKFYEKAFDCEGDLKTTAAHNLSVIYRKMGDSIQEKFWEVVKDTNAKFGCPLKISLMIN